MPTKRSAASIARRRAAVAAAPRICGVCGTPLQPEAGTKIRDVPYCDTCRDANYSKCAACNTWHPTPETVEVVGQGRYCGTCANERTQYCHGCRRHHLRTATVRVDLSSYCYECYERIFVTCSGCGASTRHENATAINGEVHCDGCRESYALCYDCDTWTSRDDMETYAGRLYCADCIEAGFCRCDSCETIIRNGEERTTEEGGTYCVNCRNERYYYCEGCEAELCRDGTETVTDNGNCYCEDHIDEYCYRCEQCESWFEGHGTCCPRCSRNRRIDNGQYTEIPKWDFGVELETSVCPSYEIVGENTKFAWKNDGSIEGKEFVSPIMCGDAGLAAIREFGRYAASHDWKVSKRCGYHLHLNMKKCNEAQKNNIRDAYLATADFWQCLVPKTRRGNNYAKLRKKGEEYCTDRYRWLNTAALGAHGTYEIRCHSATVRADKVINWVKAHVLFCVAVQDLPEPKTRELAGSDVHASWEWMKSMWPDELVEYFRGRARCFGTVLN